MIYEDEEILRAMEFRIKTKRLTGTLCKVTGDLHRAMIYFDNFDHEGYITNPYVELPKDMILQFTFDHVKILSHYLRHYVPPFTPNEINSIMRVVSKYGYAAYRNNDLITINKVRPYVR